jgi:hypothetical protein
MKNVVKQWKTKAGLQAVILFVSESHHCGYVAVEQDHPLYEVDYSTAVPGLSLPDTTPVGDRGILALFSMACNGSTEGLSPGCYFDVHGSITYAGGNDGYPVEGSGLWWFGFDCHHSGDASMKYQSFEPDAVFRDADYVERHCESLAKQLSEVAIDIDEEKIA